MPPKVTTPRTTGGTATPATSSSNNNRGSKQQPQPEGRPVSPSKATAAPARGVDGGSSSGTLNSLTLQKATPPALNGGATDQQLSHASFADLIRAREQQQQKLRGELEAQNRALRDRLGLFTSTLSSSPHRAGDEGTAAAAAAATATDGSTGDGSDWTLMDDSPTAPLQRRSSLVLQDAASLHGDTAGAGAGGGVNAQQLVDIINFVTDLKESVRRAQDADLETLRALQQRVELQEQQYEHRLSVLEARLSAEERARDILRDEQSEQVETLTASLEEIRGIGAQQLHARCVVLEESLANHQLSIQTLNLNAEGTDERCAALEGLLAAAQRTATSTDIKLQALSESVERDRSLVDALKDESIFERKEQLDSILRAAATQLEFAEKQLSRLHEATQTVQSDMESAVSQRLSQAEEQLHEHVNDTVAAAQAALDARIAAGAHHLQTLEAQVAEQAIDIKARVDADLQMLGVEYRGAVEERIAQVVARAQELEDARRAEFPVADVDRVNLMVQELEGAAVLLEGIAKNSVLPPTARPCPLAHRIETLEAHVDELQVRMSVGPDPKIMFSVDVQAGPLSHDFGPYASQDERTKRHVERHLHSELEMAAADASTLNARTETSLALLAAAGAGAVHPRNLSPSPVRSATPPTLWQSASTSRGVSPRVGGGGALRSVSDFAAGGSGDGGGTRGEGKLARIAHERQRKEATADKIQQVLREIQSKFHELSIREPLQRSLRTNSSSNDSGDARRVSEMIAKQKEAIYQKERSLVEQRNKLWHEIAALEAEEAVLLQQQQQALY